MPKSKAIVKIGTIQRNILLIRGEKVIIDRDLTEAYRLPTADFGLQDVVDFARLTGTATQPVQRSLKCEDVRRAGCFVV